MLQKLLENFVFHPPFSTPNEEGALDIHFYHEFPGRPTFIYCHGNGGTIRGSEYSLGIARKYQCNVCLFDYSGYGNSRVVPDGRPWIKQILLDGEEVVQYLLGEGIRVEDMIFWGRSLGTGVATYLAQKYPQCLGLLLVSPYTDLTAVVCGNWSPWISWFTRWTLGDNLENLEKLKNISGKMPIAILHGTLDLVIPHSHTDRIFDAIACTVHYCYEGHNTILPSDYDHVMPWLLINTRND